MLKKYLSLPFLLLFVTAGTSGLTCFSPGMMPGIDLGSSFLTATPITLDADGKAVFTSLITGNKVDVADLGPMSPGDRIILTVKPTVGSPLDPVAALFDDNQELFALNDDVDFVQGRIDSAIDEIVTVATPRMFLAITKFPLGNQEGAYEASVQVMRGQPIPVPVPQKLLLNFAGGSVSIPSEGNITVDPFDAKDINPIYDGQTNQIKNVIVNTVRNRFAGMGIQIVTSDDIPPPNPQDCLSVILFGGFSQTKFGVAQSVDQGNRDRCDDGIVFTNDFTKPFALPLPSADGVGQAIGNVAAHEAGHLLGLNHVADITDLMDTTGTASSLLAEQIFKTSRLAASVFPIGMQNGPALLHRVIPPP